MRPVLHGEDLLITTAPSSQKEISDSDEGSLDAISEASTSRDITYIPEESNTQPHLITQGELSDLVCNLYLSKQEVELLGSCLKEWNLLKNDTTISLYRNQNLMKYFNTDALIWSCCIVNGLKSDLCDMLLMISIYLFIQNKPKGSVVV